MEVDPTRICELLVGLGDVEVLGVEDEHGEPLRVHVRRRAPRPVCEGCGGALWSDGEREVELVDLPGVRAGCAAGMAQAPLALRTAGVLGGDRHRAGPRDRAATREADHPGGTLGNPPGGQSAPRRGGRRRAGMQLAPGERVGAALGARRWLMPTPSGSQRSRRWASMRP